MKKTLSYCGEMVRRHDPDRFLLSMFAPEEAREALWALFAFNYEIAKTREVVSEATLGLIRLQWWRDAIKAIYEGDDVPEHEVVKPLEAAIKAYHLPREHFDMLCYAREFDLEAATPQDTGGLLHYLDYTNTPLLKLAVQIAGGQPESEPVQAVAINYGLAGILRAIPYHARQQRRFIPDSVMNEQGISSNELYTFKAGEKLAGAVKTLSAEFVEGIRTSDKFLKSFNILADIYKAQVRSVKHDILHPRMGVEPPFKTLRLITRINFL